MILCDNCGQWQHAVCFRIIDEANFPVSHICELCAKTKVNYNNFNSYVYL